MNISLIQDVFHPILSLLRPWRIKEGMFLISFLIPPRVKVLWINRLQTASPAEPTALPIRARLAQRNGSQASQHLRECA